MDEQPPHITFGIYSGIGREEMVRWIGSIVGELKKTPLFFGQIGAFPESGVCFAAPRVTQELLDMHAKIHSKYDNLCFDKNCLYSLRDGKWIPHITLAQPPMCERGRDVAILEAFTPLYTRGREHADQDHREGAARGCAGVCPSLNHGTRLPRALCKPASRPRMAMTEHHL